jgi:predicted dehydrogenase
MIPRHDVLVIGTGSIGERHLRCFLASGRAAVAFVEPRGDVRERVAREYGVSGYDSLEAALERRFDAAVVCSPAPLHVPQARQLVDAGLHVLLEKPVSTSEDGLPELAAEVARRRVVFGVAYVLRVYPEFREMRARLRAGEWGRPLELTVTAGQHFPTWRPAYRETYYARHETGGGAIQDALTHQINLGEWLVGPISRLVCDAAHLALPGVQVEDTAHVLARQRPGADVPEVLASYALNQHQAPSEIVVQVACERGTVRCELHGQRLKWMPAPQADWQERSFGPRDRDDPFKDQAAMFLDAIEGRSEVACTLEEGWQTLRVNLAALASVRDGAWHALPAWPGSQAVTGEPR